MDDTKWFVALLLIIAILWLGGKARSVEQNRETATTTPTAQTQTQTRTNAKPPSQTGQKPPKPVPTAPAGTIIEEGPVPVEDIDPYISPLQGALKIASIQRGATVDKEYITIQATSKNAEDVVLTGIMLRSAVSLNSQRIGKGWALYFPQTSGEGEIIRLRPGGKALIASGRSPFVLTTGAIPQSGGFQLNVCTGFFEQGLNFYPSLPLQCPSLQSGPLPEAPNHFSDDCYDYLARVKKCTVGFSVPAHLEGDGSCQAYIMKHNTYSQCVADHKSDTNFYRGEWRVYLGRTSKLWHDRHDVVELLDAEGRFIDSRSY